MTTKMKGLLKGLRYISQIFDDEEKEPEMVIGFPTDVKHVAHIGMDGPSNAPPSWMNEFKGTGGEGDPNKEDSDSKVPESNSFSKASEGSHKRGTKSHHCHGSPARDLPEVPKPSRRHSSSNGTDSPTKARSEKHRHSRRASKGSPGRDFLDSGRLPSDAESESGLDSPRKLPDIPKKSRRKKSKDSSSGGSVRRSKRDAHPSPLSDEFGSAPRHHSTSSIKSVDEGDVDKGLGVAS